MSEQFLDFLQQVRWDFDKPLIINSGYRSPRHPIEARKPKPGAHTTGLAADIKPGGNTTTRFYELLAVVLKVAEKRGHRLGLGIAGMGIITQRFIHIDISPPRLNAPRPALWSYGLR